MKLPVSKHLQMHTITMIISQFTQGYQKTYCMMFVNFYDTVQAVRGR